MLRRIFQISVLAVIATLVASTDFSEEEIYSTLDQLPVTCSSTIRLQNVKSGYYLSSQEINYGSGSGQQAVTGIDNDHDYNSLWTIKEAEVNGPDGQQTLPACRTGHKFKCGSMIRLEHMRTGRNLHSHSSFEAPVSKRQEVSAFGTDGDGDGGDNWIIECESDDVDMFVFGKTKFYLKHVDTGLYLYTDGGSKYNEYNCRRCPIIGQTELSCVRGKLKNAIWKVHSGFFFPEVEEKLNVDLL